MQAPVIRKAHLFVIPRSEATRDRARREARSFASLRMTGRGGGGAPGAVSHPSRPAEADGDFSGFDDDRDPASAGEADHAVELLRVAPDVNVVERNLPTRVVLTGRGRVRSGVFSEYLDAALFHAPMIAAVCPV